MKLENLKSDTFPLRDIKDKGDLIVQREILIKKLTQVRREATMFFNSFNPLVLRDGTKIRIRNAKRKEMYTPEPIGLFDIHDVRESCSSTLIAFVIYNSKIHDKQIFITIPIYATIAESNTKEHKYKNIIRHVIDITRGTHQQKIIEEYELKRCIINAQEIQLTAAIKQLNILAPAFNGAALFE